MTDQERAPLLSTEQGDAPLATSPPPAYSDVATEAAGGGKADSQHRRRVVCEVCRTSLTYADRAGLRVVRCSRCQEATPVGPAPPGKRYLRCACHCLLTCSASSRLVACPRANCKRTVRMTPTNTSAVVVSAGQCVTCPRCQVIVQWTARSFTPRRCYACSNILPLTPALHAWALRRARINLIIGVISLLIATIVTATTYGWAASHGGFYVAPVGLFIVGAFCTVRAAMYFGTTRGVPIE